MLGNHNVGKSSLLLRYTNNAFNSESYINPPLGEKITKELEIDGSDIQLCICDTGGQEKFRLFTGSYYEGTCGVIVVFDVNDIESFRSTCKWIEEANRYMDGCAGVVKVLVGNKIDLNERRVSWKDGENLVMESGFDFYIETSAKTDENVKKLFNDIAGEIKRKWRYF